MIEWDEATCCTNSMSTGHVPTIEQMKEAVEKFRAMDAVRKSKAHFSILGMAPCYYCGRKAVYVEGPPEMIRTCRCMFNEMKNCVQSSPTHSPFEYFGGIAWEVVD